MPLESSMRFGCCGRNAGRGGMGICCQFVAWAADLESGMDSVAARIAARIMERPIRFRFIFIAHLPDRTRPGLTEHDLMDDALNPAHCSGPSPQRFLSRPRSGWCR